MLRAKSFSLGPPAAKPPKIGVIASPFLAAARPNSNNGAFSIGAGSGEFRKKGSVN
jgi:hypothetical protein